MTIAVAPLSEHEVISAGLCSVLERFPDRVSVIPPAAGQDVDILLWSTFGVHGLPDFTAIRNEYRARRLVVLCWNLDPEVVRRTIGAGADGYLSTSLSGAELVDALVRVHTGEQVISPEPAADAPGEVLPQWPGQHQGLSEREGDVVALIATGLSNSEIADRLFLSINTIKTYVRSAYQKMGVGSRSQALLWALEHGLHDQERREQAAELLTSHLDA